MWYKETEPFKFEIEFFLIKWRRRRQKNTDSNVIIIHWTSLSMKSGSFNICLARSSSTMRIFSSQEKDRDRKTHRHLSISRVMNILEQFRWLFWKAMRHLLLFFLWILIWHINSYSTCLEKWICHSFTITFQTLYTVYVLCSIISIALQIEESE